MPLSRLTKKEMSLGLEILSCIDDLKMRLLDEMTDLELRVLLGYKEYILRGSKVEIGDIKFQIQWNKKSEKEKEEIRRIEKEVYKEIEEMTIEEKMKIMSEK